MLLSLEQRVEGVKELFLRTLLAREELNVIDEQRIGGSVVALEIVDGVVLQSVHHVGNEALRMQVNDLGRRRASSDGVADGVHQMGLAEPDAAVDEQWVVGAAGIFRHLHGRRPRQLIGFAFDEIFKGEVRAQASALALSSGSAADRRLNGPRYRWGGLRSLRFRVAAELPAADLHDDAGSTVVL